MTEPTKSGISRRTLAKGAAWSVPAAAVVAAAPAYAVSINEPVIDFGKACGNTGSTQKGCGGNKTLQVPLTLSNNTGVDIVFQITSMYTCNCSTAPTAPGAGIVSGVRGVWATPSHTVANHNNCSSTTGSTCTGGVANVLVPNGTTNKNYWIESNSLGASSSFSTTINWRLLNATTCAVLDSGTAQTAQAIEPQNCGSDKTASLEAAPEPAADAKVEAAPAEKAPDLKADTASVEPAEAPATTDATLAPAAEASVAEATGTPAPTEG